MSAWLCSLGPTLGTSTVLFLGLVIVVVLFVLLATMYIVFERTVKKIERALNNAVEGFLMTRIATFIGYTMCFLTCGAMVSFLGWALWDTAYHIWQQICGM